MSAVPAVVHQQPTSLLTKIAARYSVEPGKMLGTLKQTAFRQREGEVSNEQMMALLIVADQHKLNPFLREIYAFPDKNNGVVPVVGVDGWSRIINEHPQFDGMEFVDGPANKEGMPEWIECVMHRKDRQHPTRAREYMAECKRGTQPWQSHPRRMLRHKAMIQCARLAFSFTGIYDEDEAQRIAEANVVASVPTNTAIEAINAEIAPAANQATVDQPEAQPAPTEPPAPAAAETDDPAADWLAAIESATSDDDLLDISRRASVAVAKLPQEAQDRIVDAAAAKHAALNRKPAKK